MIFGVLAATLLCSLPLAAQSQKATTAGDFWTEPPTLISLGFEWRISGDDNRNAQVEVSYRKKGETKWNQVLPLLRLQGEQTHEDHPEAAEALKDITRVTPTAFAYVAPNMFAGSILNLEPDTEYECRFVLTDSDGVKGGGSKTLTVKTGRVPEAVPGSRIHRSYRLLARPEIALCRRWRESKGLDS